MGILSRLLGSPKGVGPVFTVVDVETTGLHPSVDRVIEVGVVHLDNRGEELEGWTTLVDPGRDVGPTSIHGISARDVIGAPRFDDIADELLWWFSGTVVAAHNASFDRAFLEHEYWRAGRDPGVVPPMVCTMNGAGRLGLASSRSLEGCCSELGLPAPAHAALDDARSAAALLALIIGDRRARTLCPMTTTGTVVARRPGAPTRLRTDPPRPRQGSALGSLAARVAVPDAGTADPDSARSYVAVLDRVLEDRSITADEVELLTETAVTCGLDQASLEAIHGGYMRELWRLAHLDGVVTAAELLEIEEISALLGVSPADDGKPAAVAALVTHSEELMGRTVCFTGESACWVGSEPLTRKLAEDLAAEHGLIIKSSVSRKLDILVLADVDSQSGKAKTARSLGVRLMDERAFWRAVGVEVE